MDYLNRLYKEPLEQFEIVKIGLWNWHNSSFINFMNELVSKFSSIFNSNSNNVFDLNLLKLWFVEQSNNNRRFYIQDFAIKNAEGNLDNIRSVPRPGLQEVVEDIYFLFNTGEKWEDLNAAHNQFSYRKISTVNDVANLKYKNVNVSSDNLLEEFIFDSFDGFMNRSFHVGSNSFFINFNSSFMFGILIILIVIFLFLPITSNLRLIANGWQSTVEKMYLFIVDMLKAQVGNQAKIFFPYLFTVFIFILLSNISGMTLFAFTLTSHIMVTFTLGVSTFIGLTILGFWIQKLKFLQLFVPTGIPAVLLPMLVVIEIVSYLSRALSLSIRLFANLMSGHTLLHILAFFSSKLMKLNIFIGIISLVLILSIVVLELGIACLQAYVFTILICIYLNDSYHAGH